MSWFNFHWSLFQSNWNKSPLAWVIGAGQATSHKPNECWPCSLTPFGKIYCYHRSTPGNHRHRKWYMLQDRQNAVPRPLLPSAEGRAKPRGCSRRQRYVVQAGGQGEYRHLRQETGRKLCSIVSADDLAPLYAAKTFVGTVMTTYRALKAYRYWMHTLISPW